MSKLKKCHSTEVCDFNLWPATLKSPPNEYAKEMKICKQLFWKMLFISVKCCIVQVRVWKGIQFNSKLVYLKKISLMAKKILILTKKIKTHTT